MADITLSLVGSSLGGTIGSATKLADASVPLITASTVNVGTDPYWYQVQLLLHAEYAGSSTTQRNLPEVNLLFKDPLSTDTNLVFKGTPTIVDTSWNPKTVTPVGNALIEGDVTKFGYGAIKFDGFADSLIISSTAIANGPEDFTVEGWIYPTTLVGTDPLVYSSNTNIYINGGLLWIDGIACSSQTVVVNTWQHFAVVRKNGILTVYVNGIGGTPVADTINVVADIDLYASNVKLYLKGDGANNSTTFTDSSTAANTVTLHGNVQISTTQSKSNGSSIYFPSTPDSYLTIPSSSNFDFGSGDLTIEFWIYPLNTSCYIFNKNDEATADTSFSIERYSDLIFCYFYYALSGTSVYASGVANNTWSHVAFVRSGTTIKAFTNGVQTTSATIGTNALNFNSTVPLILGDFLGNSYQFNGYIDELRVTKGVARYSSTFTPATGTSTGVAISRSATQIGRNSVNDLYQGYIDELRITRTIPRYETTFTVPAISFADVYSVGNGTQINTAINSLSAGVTVFYPITGNQTYGSLSGEIIGFIFTLASNSAYTGLGTYTKTYDTTVSITGNTFSGLLASVASDRRFEVAISSVNFVPPTDEFGTNGTTITYALPDVDPYFDRVITLLHFNGNFYDSSPAKLTYDTSTGPIMSTSVSKFGGTSFLSTTSTRAYTSTSTQFAFGSDDFTIEFWLYTTGSTPASTQYFNSYYAGAGGNYMWFTLLYGSTRGLTVYSAGHDIGGNIPISINTWHHVAYVRSNYVTTLYIDGVVDASDANSVNYPAATISVGGTDPNVSSAGQWLNNAYLDEFRITKGVARYTGAFTPPTAPFPEISFNSANAVDPYFDKVMALLHFDEIVSAGPYALDSSPRGQLYMYYATGISSNVKFGRASAYFTGSFSYINTVPTLEQTLALPGDYTVEWWCQFVDTTSYDCTVASNRNGTSGWMMALYVTNATTITASWQIWEANGNRTFSVQNVTVPSAVGPWFHVAFVRSGTTHTTYVNGASVCSFSTTAVPDIGNVTGLNLGRDPGGPIYYRGYMDEFRMTRGLARYTTTFTPPTAAFPELSTATPATSDPYYDNVVVLAHFNGEAGAATTATDSSKYKKAITTNGIYRAWPAYPRRFGATALYTDGAAYYANIPTGNEFNFQVRDFTIELWVFPSVVPLARKAILSKFVTWSGNVDFYLGYNANSTIVFYAGDGLPISITSNDSISAGSWSHVAVTRTSGTTRLFINGIVQNAAHTGSVVIPNDCTTIKVGMANDGSDAMQGFFDDLRITSLSRYSTSFTPPTFAYPDVAYSASDGDPYYAYTTLLLKGEGTNGSTQFIDSSAVANQVSLSSGTPSISTTQSKYGSSSLKFIQANASYITADYLGVIGGDFTLEFWYYPTTLSGALFQIGGLAMAWNGYTMASSTVLFNGILPVVVNQWQHIALTRHNNTLSLFYNGVWKGSSTTTGDWSTASAIMIGGSTSVLSAYTDGYFDDFRITKGIARYVNTVERFTPDILPTVALADANWADVKLLLHFNGGDGQKTTIDSSTLANTITMVGATALSTNAKKFGDTSCYFNASSTWLSTSLNSTNIFGADYTIEAWVYCTGSSGNSTSFGQTIFTSGGSTPETQISLLLHESNGTLTNKVRVVYGNGSTFMDMTTTMTTASINIWHHIAMVKTGTELAVYIDGVKEVLSNLLTNYTPTTTVVIGKQLYNLTTPEYFKGYIDEMRITRVPRYSNSFSVPTAEFASHIVNDPLFDSVILQMDMEGASGGQSFTDSSRAPNTLIATGAATTSNVTSKSGTTSLRIPTIASTVYTSNTISLAATNFTIEFWVNISTNHSGDFYSIVGSRPNITPSRWVFDLGVQDAGMNVIYYNESNVIHYATNIVPYTKGTWAHVAIVNDYGGNTLSFYINGVLTTNPITAISPTTVSQLVIGGNSPFWTEVPYYIDDLRITKAVRYTGTYILPTSMPAYRSSAVNGDPYLKNVSLFLAGERDVSRSTNVVDSSADVVDISPVNITGITTYGASLSGEQKRTGNSSIKFISGGSQYLTVPWNNSLSLVSGDFTIECWIYVTGNTTNGMILSKDGQAYNRYPQYRIMLSSGFLQCSLGNGGGLSPTATNYTGSTTVTLNTWHHVAVVKSGSYIIGFLDGGIEWYTQQVSLMFEGGQPLFVGWESNQTGNYFSGYIDDLRITKGVARYTVPFVPTAYYPTYLDATASGTTTLGDSYYDYVILLINGNTVAITDKSSYNFALNVYGAAAYSTAHVKYGAASVYLDGSNSYITKTPATTAFNFSNVDWTIEFWLYVPSWPNTYKRIFGCTNDTITSNADESIVIEIDYNNKMGMFAYNGVNGVSCTDPNTITLNTWTHWAFTRINGFLYLYRNGVMVNKTFIGSNTINWSSTMTAYIGHQVGNGAKDLLAWIDDFRITKGIARYYDNNIISYLGAETLYGFVDVTGVESAITQGVFDNTNQTWPITAVGSVGSVGLQLDYYVQLGGVECTLMNDGAIVTILSNAVLSSATGTGSVGSVTPSLTETYLQGLNVYCQYGSVLTTRAYAISITGNEATGDAGITVSAKVEYPTTVVTPCYVGTIVPSITENFLSKVTGIGVVRGFALLRTDYFRDLTGNEATGTTNNPIQVQPITSVAGVVHLGEIVVTHSFTNQAVGYVGNVQVHTDVDLEISSTDMNMFMGIMIQNFMVPITSPQITVSTTNIEATQSLAVFCRGRVGNLTVTQYSERALTGNQATGDVSTFALVWYVPLTGDEATCAVGYSAPTHGLGIGCYVRPGTITTSSEMSRALTGVQAAEQLNTVGPTQTVDVTGIVNYLLAGNLKAIHSLNVTSFGKVGNIKAGKSYRLSGNRTNCQVEYLQDMDNMQVIHRHISGVQATGQIFTEMEPTEIFIASVKENDTPHSWTVEFNGANSTIDEFYCENSDSELIVTEVIGNHANITLNTPGSIGGFTAYWITEDGKYGSGPQNKIPSGAEVYNMVQLETMTLRFILKGTYDDGGHPMKITRVYLIHVAIDYSSERDLLSAHAI